MELIMINPKKILKRQFRINFCVRGRESVFFKAKQRYLYAIHMRHFKSEYNCLIRESIQILQTLLRPSLRRFFLLSFGGCQNMRQKSTNYKELTWAVERNNRNYVNFRPCMYTVQEHYFLSVYTRTMYRRIYGCIHNNACYSWITGLLTLWCINYFKKFIFFLKKSKL